VSRCGSPAVCRGTPQVRPCRLPARHPWLAGPAADPGLPQHDEL